MHQLGGEPSPTDHPLVKSILSDAQRLLAHRTSKKEPITVSQLEQLAACKTDAMASLYNIRTVVICLMAFAAFLRFYELSSFVQMLKSRVTSNSSKIDQSAWVVIASSGKATCPVALMHASAESVLKSVHRKLMLRKIARTGNEICRKHLYLARKLAR